PPQARRRAGIGRRWGARAGAGAEPRADARAGRPDGRAVPAAAGRPGRRRAGAGGPAAAGGGPRRGGRGRAGPGAALGQAQAAVDPRPLGEGGRAMSAADERGFAALPPELGRRVDAICTRFEAAWRAGPRPLLEAYLAEAPEPARAALLVELVAL